MMDRMNIAGAVLLIILVAAFIVASAASLLPRSDEAVTENFTLNSSEVSGVRYVNVNLESNASGVDLEFTNTSGSVYTVETERSSGSPRPMVNHTVNGENLNLNITMDTASARIMLSNGYIYNITLKTRTGGFRVVLANDSRIENLNLTIQYAGGGTVLIGNSTFRNASFNVNTGGFYIADLHQNLRASGNMSTNVTMGGTSLAISPDNILRITGSVDYGGIAFEPAGFRVIRNSTGYLELEGSGKIDIINRVGLGGVNVGVFRMPMA
ncbi:hypothetical protein DNK57_07860 [Methanothermobacter thermautotrophicus]|jgi:hypothetical protein|uniref:Adhesin domain-containing protein n=2 Tax=Methanothermobacter thermautotrophicus TaxID=145262 RepID=A0A842YQQ7_METTF|nr:hypothetical protein [Methanothermobacter thermautotrophicus]